MMDLRDVPPRQAGAYLGEGQIAAYLHQHHTQVPSTDPLSHGSSGGGGRSAQHHPQHRVANNQLITYVPVYASQIAQGGVGLAEQPYYPGLLPPPPQQLLPPPPATVTRNLGQQQPTDAIFGQDPYFADAPRVPTFKTHERQRANDSQFGVGRGEAPERVPPPPTRQNRPRRSSRLYVPYPDEEADGALSPEISEALRYQEDVSAPVVPLTSDSLRKASTQKQGTTQVRSSNVRFEPHHRVGFLEQPGALRWATTIPMPPRAGPAPTASTQPAESDDSGWSDQDIEREVVRGRSPNRKIKLSRRPRPQHRRRSYHSFRGRHSSDSDTYYRAFDKGHVVRRGGVTLRRVVQQWYRDNDGELIKSETPDVPVSRDGSGMRPVRHSNDERQKSSITVIRTYDEDGNMRYRLLRLHSVGFMNLLREVGKYTLHHQEVEGSVVFAEPFVDILYRRDGLRKFLKEEEKAGDEEIVERSPAQVDKILCAELVLDVLDNDFVVFSDSFNHSKSLKPSDLISFSDLWTIYRPGALVFAQPERQPRFAVILDSVEYSQSPFRAGIDNPKSQTPMRLHAWYIDHYSMNGRGYTGKFGRRDYTTLIAPFEGQRPISSLEFVPETFSENEEAKSKLIASGRNFWQLHGPTFREIPQLDKSGRPTSESERIMIDPAITSKSPFVQEPTSNAEDDLDNASTVAVAFGEEANPIGGMSRVPSAVDPQARQMHPSSWVNEFNVLDPSKETTDLMLLLCPPWVRGFSLRDKTWSTYPVADLRPVGFKENAWHRLVIDREYKDVVQAMVNSHLRPSDRYEDIIPGKGGGVVILLHGPPGVGKTLTAESVAEQVKKPLYMVTAGDLGTDPEHLEAKLARIFQRAAKWDAILLLDEADIFLQDRDYENLTRNALVSIFLRTLEYFKGIMFLTSNRVGAFDQAFQSRIHITLGIPQFNEDVRGQVWKIFLTDLGRPCRDGSDPLLTREECVALGREVLESWAKEPLNGRQIRNCVRSALALAQYKGQKVSAEHFNTVIRLGNTFTRYMHSLHKLESDEVAQIKGDRLADMKTLINGLN